MWVLGVGHQFSQAREADARAASFIARHGILCCCWHSPAIACQLSLRTLARPAADGSPVVAWDPEAHLPSSLTLVHLNNTDYGMSLRQVSGPVTSVCRHQPLIPICFCTELDDTNISAPRRCAATHRSSMPTPELLTRCPLPCRRCRSWHRCHAWSACT